MPGGSGGMPRGIFKMVDFGRCCWGKFSALRSQGGSCDPFEPPPK